MNFELGGVHVEAGFPLDVTLLCVGLLAAYFGLIRRHGALMEPRPGVRPVTTRQVVSFTTGVLLFWVVDGWPVVALATHLFSVHMTQHLTQAFVIPPLILLGIPEWMGDILLRNPKVRRVVKRMAGPVFAGLVFNGVLLAVHSPQAIDLQLRNDLFHAFDHMLVIAAGLFMWMNIYSPVPDIVPRLRPLVQMFYLFLMTLLPTIPSAFLIFGETPLYPIYETAVRPWNATVADDMQVGGLIMKLGGGFYLWIIIAVKYFKWAGQEERDHRDRRRARHNPTATPAPTATPPDLTPQT